MEYEQSLEASAECDGPRTAMPVSGGVALPQPTELPQATATAAGAPMSYYTPFNSPTLETDASIYAICETNAKRRAKDRDGKAWEKLTRKEQQDYWISEMREWRKLAAQKGMRCKGIARLDK